MPPVVKYIQTELYQQLNRYCSRHSVKPGKFCTNLGKTVIKGTKYKSAGVNTDAKAGSKNGVITVLARLQLASDMVIFITLSGIILGNSNLDDFCDIFHFSINILFILKLIIHEQSNHNWVHLTKNRIKKYTLRRSDRQNGLFHVFCVNFIFAMY